MAEKARSLARFIGFRKAALVSIIAGPALLIGSSAARAQTIGTVAGNGSAGYNGDGMAATASALNQPRGVAFDRSGNMFIADMSNHRIRRVNAGGTISTFAGTGAAGYSGDGGRATAAMLNQPEAVAFDAIGNLIIADSQNRRIRKVDSSGIITTIAGTGTEGYSGDGGPATSAMLHRAVDLAVGAAGDIYFADSVDNRIRKISTSGIITTVSGTGVAGFSGDGGPATTAMLDVPSGVAVDRTGNLYIADARNHRIREVRAADGSIFTVAGNGLGTGTDKGSFSGDDGPAVQAGMNTPEGVAVDAAGNLYIADTENYRVRKVTAGNGVITTIAGTGAGGFSGDGGPAAGATLNLPWSVALDAAGNVFFGELGNDRVREITSSSDATTTFAQLAIGGGYTTVFTLLNNGNDTLNGNLTLTGQDGNPLSANLTDGRTSVTGASLPITIPPGGAKFVTVAAMNGTDPTKSGWASLSSSGGIPDGVATFQLAGPNGALVTAAGVLASASVSVATLPVNDDTGANRFTGYAIANPGSSPIQIKVEEVSADVTSITALSPLSIDAGNQVASFLFQDPKAKQKFQGSVVFIGQNGATFCVVGLLQDQGLLTAIPVIPGKAPNIN